MRVKDVYGPTAGLVNKPDCILQKESLLCIIPAQVREPGTFQDCQAHLGDPRLLIRAPREGISQAEGTHILIGRPQGGVTGVNVARVWIEASAEIERQGPGRGNAHAADDVGKLALGGFGETGAIGDRDAPALHRLRDILCLQRIEEEVGEGARLGIRRHARREGDREKVEALAIPLWRLHTGREAIRQGEKETILWADEVRAVQLGNIILGHRRNV